MKIYMTYDDFAVAVATELKDFAAANGYNPAEIAEELLDYVMQNGDSADVAQFGELADDGSSATRFCREKSVFADRIGVDGLKHSRRYDITVDCTVLYCEDDDIAYILDDVSIAG